MCFARLLPLLTLLLLPPPPPLLLPKICIPSSLGLWASASLFAPTDTHKHPGVCSQVLSKLMNEDLADPGSPLQSGSAKTMAPTMDPMAACPDIYGEQSPAIGLRCGAAAFHSLLVAPDHDRPSPLSQSRICSRRARGAVVIAIVGAPQPT